MDDARINDLENEVARLRQLVERLTAVTPEKASPLPALVETTASVDEPLSSRRGMLKLAGAAAAGAVAVAVAGHASPAAAADGDPLKIGISNFGTNTTLLIGRFGVLLDSGTEAVVPGYGGSMYGYNTSTSNDAVVRAGVLGVSAPFLGIGGQTAHGVVGIAFSDNDSGSGVYGVSRSTLTSSAGVLAKANGGPSIQMIPVATGAPTAGAWTVGALQPDTAGNLWYCIAAGTPGTWRNISRPVSQFFPITPVRAYDSRIPTPPTSATAQGPLATGSNRLVSVASGRDINTGAINAADAVPAGATAITCNVTVTNTLASGFLAVNPGGNTTVTASTINWFANGQTLANGVTATLDGSRQVTVIAGGPGSTDFVIDVTGYYKLA